MERTLVIEGMSCRHCLGHLVEALKESHVNVLESSLEQGTVKVSSSPGVTDSMLRDIVEETGFKVVRIEIIQ